MKTSTEDENSLDIVTRPTKRLCHLRQIRHLQHMEAKRETSTPGSFSEPVLQERVATKYEVCKAEGNKESQGIHQSRCPEPAPQGSTGAARAGSLLQELRGHIQQSVSWGSHGHGDKEPCRDGTPRTRIWLAQSRECFYPRGQGCNRCRLFLTFSIARKAEGAARQEPAPVLLTETAPSHCPQTMNLPEPSCRPGSSSAADRSRNPGSFGE